MEIHIWHRYYYHLLDRRFDSGPSRGDNDFNIRLAERQATEAHSGYVKVLRPIVIQTRQVT